MSGKKGMSWKGHEKADEKIFANISMTLEYSRKLERFARDRRWSRSQAVRYMIEIYFEREDDGK